MDLVEVLGKQDRKVPVLLTASMTRAVEVLIDTRVSAGIPHGNPYVFANVSIRIDFPCLFRYSVCCASYIAIVYLASWLNLYC